ncbi:MAG: hypothetical protein ACT4OO_09645 [Nitrospiraceae bacterium]
MKVWSRARVLACLALLHGCAEGAKLLQETEQGGIVVYSYKGEQGHMVSSFRNEAIKLIQEQCAGQYMIVREGEAKGRTRVSAVVQGTEEIVRERRWGIQFQCK